MLNGEEGKLVNFREYVAPILDYLVGLGIPAKFGERNEILAGDVKISGNAEHIHRNRVLHHGTLLFSSDLDKLRTALDTKPELYVDKAVQSIRSEVGNIRDFLNKETGIEDFRRQLIAHIMFHFPGSEIFTLSDEEAGRIRKLVAEKYSLWKWNIGYFPKYQLEREWSLGRIRLKAELNVEKGKISGCRLAVTRQYLSPDDDSSAEILEITGPDNEYGRDAKDYGNLEDILSEHTRDLDTLAQHIIGQSHDPESLRAYLSERKLVNPEWIDNFVKGLF
jgi:lipoate-protein ligase A